MSSYRAHATAIRRHEAIIEALADRAKAHARALGRSEAEAEATLREHVELHPSPGAPLQQYRRDTDRLAEIILRQPHCAELLGCATWEDIGFSRTQDETFEAHMSGHDYWWQQAEGEARFLQYAQATEARLAASLEGYDVHIEEADGLLQVVCDSLF